MDGKTIVFLTDSTTQTCYICECKPTEMNNLKKIYPKTVNIENLKYDLTTLHAWIRFLECILHIAYKINLKAPTKRGATEAQLADLESRKKIIHEQLHQELGIPS